MADDRDFRRTVTDFYRLHGRHDLPWRQSEADGSFDPYKIMVSEVMLQQTQVGRVIPKFLAFVERFPDPAALARAPLGDVLRAWSGLGYNRRAKYLQQAARLVAEDRDGKFPPDVAELASLPGIGGNTAGAIRAYAFGLPAVFVETNIRTVYIHHFFAGRTAVPDALIRDKVAETLPKTNIRTWYWAFMDYGTYLKQSVGNLNRASSSYSKQSAFDGSRRQLRGRVIRLLGDRPYSYPELAEHVSDDRLPGILEDLIREALIRKANGVYCL